MTGRPRGNTSFLPIHEAKVTLTAKTWPFASDHAPDINAHWLRRTSEQPGLYDGVVLLLYNWSLSDGRFTGECLKADFKSFLFWREHGSPDPSVFDFFACGAVHSREGWIMVGCAGAQTAYPGAIFPPCGSLHPDDVSGTQIDLDASMLRELKEETGLSPSLADVRPPALILDRQRIVYLRPIMLARSANEIAKEVRSYLASVDEPELADIRFVRGLEDIDEAAMSRWALKYVREVWSADGEPSVPS